MPIKPYTTEKFINICNKKHNFKYNYSKSIYINSRSKIIIICPLHGEFKIKSSSHISGVGCALCRNLKNSIDNTFTAYGTGASGDYVSNVDILSDGKIIIGGFFETFNGAQVYGIGKLNTDGSLDTAFKTGTGYGFAPNSIGVFYTNPSHTGDYIYVAGTFGSYNYSGVSYSAQGGIDNFSNVTINSTLNIRVTNATINLIIRYNQ